MIDSPKWDPLSPKRIEDIVGNSDLWRELAATIRGNKSTNLVLIGPPGCGKSLFLRLALSGFLTLVIDCTANFGLRDVRDNIRHFARGGRDGANLRWIIFEHADSLTADTQAYLRRMLETTHNTTRICFECNDAGAITEPIISRCTLKYAYAPDDLEVRYELRRRFNFGLSDEIVDALCKLSMGNLRTAMLRALAVRHLNNYQILEDMKVLKSLKSKKGEIDLLSWALEAENTCRNNGIDLRMLLLFIWGRNPIVTQTLTEWSRLGGISCRAQFFSCVNSVGSSAEKSF